MPALFYRQGAQFWPEGLTCHASWVDAAGTQCFQVMEAPSWELLKAWISGWHDLVSLEVVPVLISSDFWARV
jgi:hypothetical protein